MNYNFKIWAKNSQFKGNAEIHWNKREWKKGVALNAGSEFSACHFQTIQLHYPTSYSFRRRNA
ncbi:hypothetical protein [Chryseobacterium koreense]|uniref:hypothetical protein n=1 Tax=Chryseobacterium koreense TaxID=232216 RepID=UPI0026F1CC71|nr:hypothetical protein [Chryseobacterium koreense]